MLFQLAQLHTAINQLFTILISLIVIQLRNFGDLLFERLDFLSQQPRIFIRVITQPITVITFIKPFWLIVTVCIFIFWMVAFGIFTFRIISFGIISLSEISRLILRHLSRQSAIKPAALLVRLLPGHVLLLPV